MNEERFERISFVIPFNDENELIKPQTKFSLDNFPGEIKLMIRIGFVGLKPSHQYNMKIFVYPSHMRIKVGETVQHQNPFAELASLNLDTKGTILGSFYVDGQVTITLDNVIVPAKGIYQIRCELTDTEESEQSIHENFSYYTVE
ncbi:hypothetical protein [Serratia sp. PL7]|uniref:hypothetical protein n=1 Tax=Serratia sp. PL7 TaxID=2952201 RepID=UPI0021AD7F4F|nr:hypothetical protein [Serratia sp. PL7]